MDPIKCSVLQTKVLKIIGTDASLRALNGADLAAVLDAASCTVYATLKAQASAQLIRDALSGGRG